MKLKTFYTAIIPLFLPAVLNAQLFTKVTTGSIVTHTGDSRSVNFIDVNNDGWDDLFITNGPEGGDVNFLYLNNDDGTFNMVSGDDIVSAIDPFDGATFADCDNDGDVDAITVTWWNQKNHFYLNNGNGTFTEETSAAPALPSTYSETASWGDYDLDGYVDLYVSNSDGDFKNLLYHNNGDGTFTKIVTGTAATDAFTSRGVTWADYDNDGDADLYVANESSQANNLYRNDGDGSFTKITTGPQVSDSRSTMSASWGDIDNDGDLDLYTANSGNFTGQKNQLYINNGSGGFSEVTSGDLVNDFGCSFSSSFEDYDNDGDLDIAVSNGFCNGTILNFLYQNDGQGNFTRDLSSITDLNTPCSYGCAWGDANNDGFPDLVFATCNNNSLPDPVDLFYLNSGNGNHWIKIKLEGTKSNHSAIGARVKIKAIINGSPVWQMREVTAQSGYCSQNSLTVHFGLGDATTIDSVSIHFAGGNDTALLNIPANQTLFVKEAGVTGINETGNFSAMRCFPNPAFDSFTVLLNQKHSPTRTLRLLSLLGVLVDEKKISGTENPCEWKLAMKPPRGIYILEAAGENWKERIPLVID